MNIITVTHAKCPDGIAAKLILQEALTEAKHKIVQYEMDAGGQLPLPLSSASDRIADLLILCDVSYPLDGLKKLVSDGIVKTVWVIDHHKSAFELLEGAEAMPGNWMSIAESDQSGVFVTLNSNRSGAMLAYDMFWINNDILRDNCFRLAMLVEDRDLWRFHYPDTNYFHLAFNEAIQSGTEQEWWNARRLDPTNKWRDDAVETGKTLKQMRDRLIKSILGTKQSMNVVFQDSGRRLEVPYVFGPHELASELGNELAKQHRSNLGIVITEVSDKGFRLSVRGVGSADTLQITHPLGGGGHVLASGCMVERGMIRNVSSSDLLTMVIPTEAPKEPI